MDRIIDRFDMYMKYRNLNDNKVSVNCNLSIGLLGKSRKVGADLGKQSIEKILKFYTEINQEWLLHGYGNMLNTNTEQVIHKNTILKESSPNYSCEKSELRLLLEQNAQLVKNNTTLVETISKISEELINLHRQSKNAHAREDAGCADVG